MNKKKKINRSLTRNLIISSIVWAAVIIGCSVNSGGSNKEILYVLIAGFFVEFLRITSFNKSLLKDSEEEGN